MILQLNDGVFVSQFSDIGQGFGLTKKQQERNKDFLVPFFNNSAFIKDCIAILLNYLLKDETVNGHKIITEVERSYLRQLVNMVF